MKSNFFFLIVFITFTIKILNIQFLNKYEKITVPVTDGFIYFNASNFSKDEEIYLKVTARTFKEYYLTFEFFDDDDPSISYNPGPKNTTYKTSREGGNKNTGYYYYFSIKKKDKYLDSLQGKYLKIFFHCDGDEVTIENIDKSSGNTPLYIIIIFIIIAIVSLIVGIIVYFKKKNKNAGMNMNTKNIEAINEYMKNRKDININDNGQSSIQTPIKNNPNNSLNINIKNGNNICIFRKGSSENHNSHNSSNNSKVDINTFQPSTKRKGKVRRTYRKKK